MLDGTSKVDADTGDHPWRNHVASGAEQQYASHRAGDQLATSIRPVPGLGKKSQTERANFLLLSMKINRPAWEIIRPRINVIISRIDYSAEHCTYT